MTEQTKYFLRMFVGWISAVLPELNKVEIPKMAESLERFIKKMEEEEEGR